MRIINISRNYRRSKKYKEAAWWDGDKTKCFYISRGNMYCLKRDKICTNVDCNLFTVKKNLNGEILYLRDGVNERIL